MGLYVIAELPAPGERPDRPFYVRGDSVDVAFSKLEQLTGVLKRQHFDAREISESELPEDQDVL